LFIFLILLIGTARLASATTIVPLRFDEVVRQAGLVVEGTVTEIRVWPTGADLPPAPQAAVSALSPTAPIGAGVEGGRSLFTEVTLRVGSQIGGDPAPEIRFTLAGGSKDGESFKVFGMPEFEVGGRYIVMLRPDYEQTNVPVVGVSQGFFEVASDPATGGERLLNADGDILLAIENGRVVLRHNPARSGSHNARLGPAPVPETGSAVMARTSPEVERYWASKEEPLAPESFLDAVRAMKGVQQ
jgi:hypothetical protein